MKTFRHPFLLFPFLIIDASICFAQAPGTASQATPLLVAKVAEATPSLSRECRGTAEAIETVHVIARVSGLLEKVNFKEGNTVDKGELLFNIEDTEYVANLRAAKAQVVSCESTIKENRARIIEIQAKIKYAQANYNRCKQLFENGRAASEDDVDNALATLESEKAQLEAANAALTNAEGQLELAKSRVDIAEFDFSHTTIYSPIKGRAGRLIYTQGNYITPNNGALITIAQLDPIYVRFSISETDFVSLFGSADALRDNTALGLWLADNTEYQGKGEIKFIDNQITPLDTLQVWAEFENPDGVLTPGGIVKVVLTKPGNQTYPSVPASAIMHDDRGEFVYVTFENKLPDGSTSTNLRKRQIVLGLADGNTQCVTKGLEPGEVVVTGGSNKINPLMLVDEKGVSIVNPQVPALPIKPVFNQEALVVEENAVKAAPADNKGATDKKAAKSTTPATKPNGRVAQ